MKLLVNSKIDGKMHKVDLDLKTSYITTPEECGRDRNIGDTFPIAESNGTLAYINTEYKLYGILKERHGKGKVGIIWMPIDLFLKDPKAELISNRNGALKDVTELGEEIFKKSFYGKFYSTLMFSVNLSKTTISKETFIKRMQSINNSNIQKEENTKTEDIIENKVEDVMIDEEINKSSDEMVPEANSKEDNSEGLIKQESTKTENTEKQIKEMFSDYMNNIELKLAEVIKREEAVTKKEIELNEKFNKLTQLLIDVESNNLENVVNTILDIDSIVINGEKQESVIEQSDAIYELLLKIISKHDNVSIPLSYYRKLKVTLRKSLECNKAITRYKAIASIKFNSAMQENIVAIVDYDENSPLVGINILKPYNTVVLTDTDIGTYVVDYQKRRREKMTIG